MTALLLLPIVIPLAAAVLSLLLFRSTRAQHRIAVAAAAGLTAASASLLRSVQLHGIQAAQVGSWPAPFGITVVADLLAAAMVLITGIISLAVVFFSLFTVDAERQRFGYYPLLHILVAGVSGAFLTGDIFNLFVWFEVMLMASFALLALGGERRQLEGAIKYVALNLITSAVFLTAVGLIYGVAGTLNMADLHLKLRALQPVTANAIAALLMIAFGLKAAVFPLFFWLPASYHTPPAAVSALFAGLLTKVGVYALIRTFTLLFPLGADFTAPLILWCAGLTMLSGVLGAMAQNEFRRILSFHIVSQIGYMIMGLGLSGVAPTAELADFALAASIFYIIHHIIVKANLFLISGAAERLQGSAHLKSMGGLYDTHPGLSIFFLIAAFSLAGVPPLSGFFAKLSLVSAGLQSGTYVIVGVALLVGLFTLISMTKIWAEAFWKASPATAGGAAGSAYSYRAMLLPIAALALLTVAIGLAAEPVFALSKEAAYQLRHPDEYLRAVGIGLQ